MTTGYFTHTDCARHDMGKFHPECPERMQAIADAMIASGLQDVVDARTAAPASQEQLLRAHSAVHVASLAQLAELKRDYIAIDPDTILARHSYSAALHAAGACVDAVDAVMSGELRNAFCAVRPPGHHAMHGKAMGFCFFNSIAVGAMHALHAHGLERVAIIDFDVHHGNGTEDIFKGDERVQMLSFFQHPFYPFSGAEQPAANMHNTPLAAYTRGAQVRELVEQEWLPKLRAFRPQMLLISAGFDAHRDDDLGQMGLVEADFAWITEQLMAVAGEVAQSRIVSSLEGGYNLSALARSVVAHVRTLTY
jgi:acetoin utilization deacetylase AcuC-like enzyme